jgi:hypothetical protein
MLFGGAGKHPGAIVRAGLWVPGANSGVEETRVRRLPTLPTTECAAMSGAERP